MDPHPPHRLRAGLRRAAGQPARVGEAFQITSDEALPWDQIARTLAGPRGSSRDIVHVPSDAIAAVDPSGGPACSATRPTRWCSTTARSGSSRAGSATVPFARGAREIVEWHDADPARRRVDDPGRRAPSSPPFEPPLPRPGSSGGPHSPVGPGSPPWTGTRCPSAAETRDPAMPPSVFAVTVVLVGSGDRRGAVPAIWRVLRLAVTLVDELGHAMVGLDRASPASSCAATCPGTRSPSGPRPLPSPGPVATCGRATPRRPWWVRRWSGPRVGLVGGTGPHPRARCPVSRSSGCVPADRGLATLAALGATGALWWWRDDTVQAQALAGPATVSRGRGDTSVPAPRCAHAHGATQRSSPP